MYWGLSGQVSSFGRRGLQTFLPLSRLLALLVTARRFPFVLERGQPCGLDWPKAQSCWPLPHWLTIEDAGAFSGP